jgi:hypothetical protein
VVNATPRPF